MGTKNVIQVAGSPNVRNILNLSIKEILFEFFSKDRTPIDFDSPVELGEYPLVARIDYKLDEYSFVDRINNNIPPSKKDNFNDIFLLPTKSYKTMKRVIDDVKLKGYNKGFSENNKSGAHEYLIYPSVKSSLKEMVIKTKQTCDAESLDDFALIRIDDIKKEFLETLAQLGCAQLHLYHRQDQWKNKEELKGLFYKLQEQIVDLNDKAIKHMKFIGPFGYDSKPLFTPFTE